MHPIKCPHCGAPPPAQFVAPFGQFTYACVYCRQTSVLGAPVAPPPRPSPSVIVVHSPSHYDAHQVRQVYGAHMKAARLTWIVWVIVILVVSLGGSGALFMRCSKHSTILSSLVWDGSEPLNCTGIDEISVTGVEATFNSGSAIVATGNCRLRCTDCKISAPTAIEASGNAQVTIINGSVQGTAVLADASGNARVTITGNVTSSGRIRESGLARVSAPPPRPVATSPALTSLPADPPTPPVATPARPSGASTAPPNAKAARPKTPAL